MALYLVSSGGTSNITDANQLVTLLNGTTTNTAVVVKNRIRAALPGVAATGGGLVGGTLTAGDRSQNRPSTQPSTTYKPKAPVTGANAFVIGDSVADAAGVLWVATANTSASVTPWIAVGTGGDNSRTRSTLTAGIVNSTVTTATYDYGGYDYGGIQYINSAHSSFGYLIPATGIYSLATTFKAHGSGSTANMYVAWFKSGVAVSVGDVVQGGSSLSGDIGSVSEDLVQLTAGDIIVPSVVYNGPAGKVGPSIGTVDANIYAAVQLVSSFYSS